LTHPMGGSLFSSLACELYDWEWIYIYYVKSMQIIYIYTRIKVLIRFQSLRFVPHIGRGSWAPVIRRLDIYIYVYIYMDVVYSLYI
jgi:hypothetical protein